MLSSMIIILMVLCVNLKWLNWMEIIFKMNLRKLRIKLEIYIIMDRVGISYNNGDRCYEMQQDLCVMFILVIESQISVLFDLFLNMFIMYCLFRLICKILCRRNYVVLEELKYLVMNVFYIRYMFYLKNIRSLCISRKFVKMGIYFFVVVWFVDVELLVRN